MRGDDLGLPKKKNMSGEVPLYKKLGKGGSKPAMPQTSPRDDHNVLSSVKPRGIGKTAEQPIHYGRKTSVGNKPKISIDYDKI